MSKRAAEVATELYAAVARGDEPTTRALLDPDVRWRGRDRGHLWWRNARGCEGHEDALRNFRLLRHKVPQLGVAETIGSDEQALVSLSGHTPEGAFHWFPLVTVKAGRVVAIRDFGHRHQARRALRRATRQN